MSLLDPDQRQPDIIGGGDLGGKARGLVFFDEMLEAEFDASRFAKLSVRVPRFAVVTTELFAAFVRENRLTGLATDDVPDSEIAEAFQRGELPEPLAGFVERVAKRVDVPLAVRSSSVLEDAVFCPLAGVYETKMIPNNRPDPHVRRREISDAIKLVWASTYFHAARAYRTAAGKAIDDEQMAVVVQELVGETHGRRFYPHVSGVARSHSFYPAPGARPADGVVLLALGLGKTIVDGGTCWSYSPTRPNAPPPYGSPSELLKNSQLKFWGIDLTAAVGEDPTAGSEFLVRGHLGDAEEDGVLQWLGSTLDVCSDRMVPGVGRQGPRALTFAPLLSLNLVPLNDVLQELLAIGERAAGTDVEIEFAMTMDAPHGESGQLGLLQIRPMFVSHEEVPLALDEMQRPDVLLSSTHVMGNGSIEGIHDVVFVERSGFETRLTRAIAAELEKVDRELREAGRPYLLIGFGRWGSSDPSLGIPVDWSQIAGVKILVETHTDGMLVEPSQGSHFFHNLACFGVSYLSVHPARESRIDWEWLEARQASIDARYIRHVRLDRPITARVDGRSGRAVVLRP